VPVGVERHTEHDAGVAGQGPVSEPLEWTEKGEDDYEARSGQRRYVVPNQSGLEWMVQGFAQPNPNRDIEVKFGDPVLRRPLEDVKQQAHWWESEQKLWQKGRNGIATVKVYFRGYTEYELADPQAVVDAAGFGDAPGTADQKASGELQAHTTRAYKRGNYEINGASVVSEEWVSSLQSPE
jgi:hypothetical protein